jgi:hypothetical protein
MLTINFRDLLLGKAPLCSAPSQRDFEGSYRPSNNPDDQLAMGRKGL